MSAPITPPPSANRWLPFARLLRPQGRRGELLAEPLTDLPEAFAAGRTVFLALPDSPEPASIDAPRLLEEAWHPTGRNAGRVVLKLSGCDSISEAEHLAGQDLLQASEALSALDSDTFFVRDLLGCELFDGAIPAGKIVDVQFATSPDGRKRLENAAPLLGIARNAAPDEPPAADSEDELILIPFVRAWLQSVDVEARRIVMNLPPGLLDTA